VSAAEYFKSILPRSREHSQTRAPSSSRFLSIWSLEHRLLCANPWSLVLSLSCSQLSEPLLLPFHPGLQTMVRLIAVSLLSHLTIVTANHVSLLLDGDVINASGLLIQLAPDFAPLHEPTPMVAMAAPHAALSFLEDAPSGLLGLDDDAVTGIFGAPDVASPDPEDSPASSSTTTGEDPSALGADLDDPASDSASTHPEGNSDSVAGSTTLSLPSEAGAPPSAPPEGDADGADAPLSSAISPSNAGVISKPVLDLPPLVPASSSASSGSAPFDSTTAGALAPALPLASDAGALLHDSPDSAPGTPAPASQPVTAAPLIPALPGVTSAPGADARLQWLDDVCTCAPGCDECECDFEDGSYIVEHCVWLDDGDENCTWVPTSET
jgi:hypothetical protein